MPAALVNVVDAVARGSSMALLYRSPPSLTQLQTFFPAMVPARQ
jgi:hypothetical protein